MLRCKILAPPFIWLDELKNREVSALPKATQGVSYKVLFTILYCCLRLWLFYLGHLKYSFTLRNQTLTNVVLRDFKVNGFLPFYHESPKEDTIFILIFIIPFSWYYTKPLVKSLIHGYYIKFSKLYIHLSLK